MSSFKISPTHDRIFNSIGQITVSEDVDDGAEDDVGGDDEWTVDEATGEITQAVTSHSSQKKPGRGAAARPVQRSVVLNNNNEPVKFTGFAMRKKIKASFM